MIPPIEPIRLAAGPGPAAAPAAPASPGFGKAIDEAIGAVSDAEHEADALARDLAAGGPTQVHEVMVATTKASLSLDLLVQVRNRAVEAYQEIMRMQI